MYAVEEYGKAILLKKSIKGNKERYDIDGWILGFGNPPEYSCENNLSPKLKNKLVNLPTELKDTFEKKKKLKSHDYKIKEGFDNLPENAKNIFRGIRIKASDISSNPKTIYLSEDHNVSITTSSNASGTYYDTTHTSSQIDYWNRDLKTTCFYMDWDEINKSWCYDIVIDYEVLKNNIDNFGRFLKMEIKCQ